MSLYVGDPMVGIPHGHLHRVTYIRGYIDELTILIMSTWLVETCRELE